MKEQQAYAGILLDGELSLMSRILITGAAGFIGTRLVSALQTGHELFVLVRPRTPRKGLLGVKWIEQDLARPLDPSHLPDRLDAIIHLAQSRHYREFPEQAKDIFDVNIHGTFQLLEYARQAGVKCFIFASSGGVYGYSYESFFETDPVSPLNFYLSSKYTAELLLANYQTYFKTIVFRFFFVYGPEQKGMLISNLLHKVMHGESITVEGNPGLRINPIYVEDAIRVFEPALNLETAGLFNVAGDEAVTLTDLVNLIGKAAARQPQIHYRAIHASGDLIGDNERMKEALKVLPMVSLPEGVREMVRSAVRREERSR
jgi:nucleoside-diphosphate-sugar epimerase